jgi:hypothetical protein
VDSWRDFVPPNLSNIANVDSLEGRSPFVGRVVAAKSPR